MKGVDTNLLGQMAGIVAILSAVVNSLPQASRDELKAQIQASFEPLISVMLADDGTDADEAIEGAEMVRDMFLGALR